jgi:hypothetical protein
MRKIFMSLMLTCLAWSAHAAGDASGTWTASFDTQVGKQSYTYVFQVQGAQLSGTVTSANGSGPLVDGKVAGTTITFTENLDYQGQKIAIKYTGELAGDEIRFKRDVGGFGVEEFVAARTK